MIRLIEEYVGMNEWSDYPHLLADLDMSKNKNHTSFRKPIQVLELSTGTSKKLDWKCSTCEHEWTCTGYRRTRRKTGCPACAGYAINNYDGRNSLAVLRPDLAAEYQSDATKVLATTEAKLDWKCSTCEHEWSQNGHKRVIRNYGCPACAGRSINNYDGRNAMAVTHPELVSEYQGDATKVVAGTHLQLDWKCSTCEHEWKATGDNRSLHSGNPTKCPACDNKAINNYDGRNAMALTHPKLAKEYQGDATKVVAGTNKRLLWKCSTCFHKWKASGGGRAGERNRGCPACENQAINNYDGRNAMAVTHPELASEYQGDATKVLAGTNKRLLWKCSICDNTWATTSNHRFTGTGCPTCAETGFKPSEPAYCYLLKYQFSDGVIRYKQGITNNVTKRMTILKMNVNKVFPETKVTLIDQMYFEVGQDALDLENHFKSISEIRWTPEQKFDGSTEMYAEGILEAWIKSVK